MTTGSFKNINGLQGATSGGPSPIMVDFDVRPLVWNLERIAAAVEKVQLRVDIPPFNPVVQVEAPVVNIEARPGSMTVALEPAPQLSMPGALPQITINTPAWPTICLLLVTVVQIAIALNLFK